MFERDVVTGYIPAFLQQQLGQMEADNTSSARDESSHPAPKSLQGADPRPALSRDCSNLVLGKNCGAKAKRPVELERPMLPDLLTKVILPLLGLQAYMIIMLCTALALDWEIRTDEKKNV